MALDTYTSIYKSVLLRCPAASSFLARQWVSHAFRRVAERRLWSWLIKYNQFTIPLVYNTGTVVATNASTAVVGTTTVWTQSHVGQQFRIGTQAPIYTIKTVTDSTHLDLDLPFGFPTQTDVGYEIYQAYVTPPSDFLSFVSVLDPRYNWQLNLNYSTIEIDRVDAQRSNRGNAYAVVGRDYSTTSVGTVAAVLQVVGTGPAPLSSGTYTGPNDAIFTVTITTGGASGTAIYKWKKDSGTFTTGVATSTTATALADGVKVAFPAATYVVNDTFVVRVAVGNTVSLPRYELWPHQRALYVYPYLYISRAVDLEDTSAVLPRYIRGDVLLDMAMAEAARWPGPSVDKKNPFFDLALAAMYDKKAETEIMEMEKQDDEIFETDAQYQMSQYPFSPYPMDSAWMQKHDVGAY